MESERKWIIVRIDGKIAAVSTDYRLLAEISARIAYGTGQKKKAGTAPQLFGSITAETVSLEEVWQLKQTAKWEELLLFGTDFQKKVWRKLWELTHKEDSDRPALICYSDFAELCRNRAGVRAVAHAVGQNPVSVLIPCHLIVPKEATDRIAEIIRKAEKTLFGSKYLSMEAILNDPFIDFGNYALGRKLKRVLIEKEFMTQPSENLNNS